MNERFLKKPRRANENRSNKKLAGEVSTYTQPHTSTRPSYARKKKVRRLEFKLATSVMSVATMSCLISYPPAVFNLHGQPPPFLPSCVSASTLEQAKLDRFDREIKTRMFLRPLVGLDAT